MIHFASIPLFFTNASELVILFSAREMFLSSYISVEFIILQGATILHSF